MCSRLEDFRRSIVAYAAQFDATALTAAQAGEAVLVCAQIEGSVASIKSLAAARAAEGAAWRSEGYRSAADELAQKTGISPSTAKRALDTGRRLQAQPDVAKAALSGQLSPEQTAVVAEGVEADPDKATKLLEQARRGSLSELSDEVARVKAAVTDREARRKAIHARRFLRRWSDRDGALHAHLYGHVEDGTTMWRMLDPIRRRLAALRDANASDANSGDANSGDANAGDANAGDAKANREPFEALDYDALIAMAQIAAGGSGELSLEDLLELGLFPQLDAAMLADLKRRSTGSAASAGSHAQPQPGRQPDPRPEPSPEPGDGAYPDHGAKPEPGPGPGADTDPPTDARGPSSPTPAAARRRPPRLVGGPTKILVRVDLETLLRGVPLEGELCEITGYGPIPVSVIDKLAANGNAFLVGVLTKNQQVIGVYRHRRRPDVAQASALEFLYPTCAVAGCNARAALQIDHREDWARTRFTVFDLLDRLCPRHHRQKTNHGWALVPGTGKRAFVPPDDQRHPRHPGHARRQNVVETPDPP